MKKLTFVIASFIAFGVFAQEQGSITGKIMDLEMNNEPLLLANVQLKGDSKTTQTNFHGNFEFRNVPIGEHTLVVSYAGYDKLEIPVLIEKNKISKIQAGLYQKTIHLDHFTITGTIEKEFPGTIGSR